MFFNHLKTESILSNILIFSSNLTRNTSKDKISQLMSFKKTFVYCGNHIKHFNMLKQVAHIVTTDIYSVKRSNYNGSITFLSPSVITWGRLSLSVVRKF
jgi:hypothetical protein